MLAATFDIGTTAVKAVVVRDDRTAVFTDSAPVHTIEKGNFREQNPDEWYEAFCKISRRIFTEIPAEKIDALVFSGQMQDVIPVDAGGNAVRNAILYSDGRAQAQAERILEKVGKRLTEITGNHFDGSMPLAKILWLKEQEPEHYERASSFLISSKDYVIGKLTGNLVGDVTACSTAGAMDLEKKCWSEEMILAAGLQPKMFPGILQASDLAGTVTETAAAQTGYLPGTGVYAGTGDAGATTLASGILYDGEFNINLGTSSWVAAVSGGCMECEGGGFNLAAMQREKYINVVPFFNGGNVHKFLGKVFSRNQDGKPDYDYVSALLAESRPGGNGVFFLPYLAGERFPVVDEEIRGCYLGIGQETTASDLARSALEGVAFSIRQGLELFDSPVKKLTLIGGGAREEAWCRILSSVMGAEIYVYKNPDLLPALAIASSVFLAEGLIQDYEEFIRGLERQGYCTICRPEAGTGALYDELFEKYKTIYPMVRGFYKSR